MDVSRFNSTPSVNIINFICGVQLDKWAQLEVDPFRLEVNSTEEYKSGGAPLHLCLLNQVFLQERERLVR